MYARRTHLTRLQRSLAAWTIAAAIVASYLAFGRIGHFLDYGFAGYFAILLVNRPTQRNLAACGCAAVALAALLGWPPWTEAPQALSLPLAYLGVGAAIILAVPLLVGFAGFGTSARGWLLRARPDDCGSHRDAGRQYSAVAG